VVAVQRGVRASFAHQTLSGKVVDTQLQGGLVCMEMATGNVLASVGSTSFALSSFDRATQARRMAGSPFKTFVYATALNQGWSSGSPVEDNPLSITGRDGKAWSPHNYSGRYYGQTTLADALSQMRGMLRSVVTEGTGKAAEGINSRLPYILKFLRKEV
jgi:penicillin-binding protein 1A